jgi:uncharacterized protein involved in outer membrane biogenesis
MKTKKTVLKFVVLPLVILLVVIAAVFFLIGNTIIKTSIEKAASSTLGVPVTIKIINLSILQGHIGIKGLVVKNPPGYANETLLELGEAIVDLDIYSLMSNAVKIKLIKLDGTQLTMEQKGLTNNLKEVLDNMPKEQAAEKPAAEEKGKDLLIDKLEITNTKVKVKLLPLPGKSDTVSLNIDPIIMTGLGTEKKLKMSELVAKVIGAIATGIVKQGAGLLPDDMVNGIGSATADMSKAATQEGQKIIEGTKDAGKTMEGFKGLFGGKKDEPNK